MLLVSALEDSADGKLIIAAVPTQRAGIRLFEDWDNMGQRQTDSGSAVFERVAVAEDEILADPGPLSSPRACLRPLLAAGVRQRYLGIAEGAFAEARNYTRTQARLWPARRPAR
jgi:alkylation response protein AidB-like acyl-CoA dehydrogenase